jgi:hypothetical protein
MNSKADLARRVAEARIWKELSYAAWKKQLAAKEKKEKANA